MENNIRKITKLKDGWQSEINLVEMADGQYCVRKNYTFDDPKIMNEELDALVFLYDKGFNVAKPIRKDEDGIYMQYAENGALWDFMAKLIMIQSES